MAITVRETSNPKPQSEAQAQAQQTLERGAHNKFLPKHYKTYMANGLPIEAIDVIEAFFFQDAHLSQAFKYMARAGRKQDESYVDDIKKARFWLERAVDFYQRQPVSLEQAIKEAGGVPQSQQYATTISVPAGAAEAEDDEVPNG